MQLVEAFDHGAALLQACAKMRLEVGEMRLIDQARAATVVSDAMHALLVKRADELEGCIEGSPEETEFASIADALEAYEQIRWPEGKVPGGKG